MIATDYVALGLFLILFFGYNSTYFFISHNLKKETRESKINVYREKWLEIIIAENQSTFAIQTIRNLTMANTFLMSLVMIMMGGLISVISSRLDLISTLETINQVDSRTYLLYFESHPAVIKILLGLFVLLISAYNLTVALRILYNMNFTTSSAMRLPEAKNFQLDQLRRQSRHFITGLRSLYFFFGPMLWIIDTYAMIIFTIVVTVLFLRFDFIPRVPYKKGE
ncbi:MAG: DUF599 domain-containing protein [Spirochaetia bacterium]|nr:DUF599 domain-containing protein [Spirochaetia bacterium]